MGISARLDASSYEFHFRRVAFEATHCSEMSTLYIKHSYMLNNCFNCSFWARAFHLNDDWLVLSKLYRECRSRKKCFFSIHHTVEWPYYVAQHRRASSARCTETKNICVHCLSMSKYENTFCITFIIPLLLLFLLSIIFFNILQFCLCSLFLCRMNNYFGRIAQNNVCQVFFMCIPCQWNFQLMHQAYEVRASEATFVVLIHKTLVARCCCAFYDISSTFSNYGWQIVTWWAHTTHTYVNLQTA